MLKPFFENESKRDLLSVFSWRKVWDGATSWFGHGYFKAVLATPPNFYLQLCFLHVLCRCGSLCCGWIILWSWISSPWSKILVYPFSVLTLAEQFLSINVYRYRYCIKRFPSILAKHWIIEVDFFRGGGGNVSSFWLNPVPVLLTGNMPYQAD
jgi:hypothetical protein